MLPLYNDLEQELFQKKGLKDKKKQLTEDQNPGGPTLCPESSCSSSEEHHFWCQFFVLVAYHILKTKCLKE